MTSVTLVFPPTFDFPSYAPPLGIAYLRSYLLYTLPGAKVQAIDSNLIFLNALLEEPKMTMAQVKRCCASANALPPDVLHILETKTDLLALSRLFTELPFFLDDWVYHTSLSRLSRSMSGLLESASLLFQEAATSSPPLDFAAELLSLLGLRDAANAHPDLVGFSALYSTQIPVSFLAALAIRQVLPNALIVLGGAAVSQMPSNNYEALINPSSPFDCLCIGDGERSLTALAERAPSGRGVQIHDIPNLVSLSKTGAIMQSPSLPFDKVRTQPVPCFDEFDLAQYHNPYPLFPILSSRGCSWHKCRFCDYNRNYLHRYRPRPVEQVVDEMEARLEFCSPNAKPGFFAFEDSEIPPARAECLAREIIRRGIKVRYFFLARPIKGFTSAVLSLLQQSGCRLICFGVESFNQRILDLENKGTRRDYIIEVLGRTKRAGIKTYCLYFTGFPSQTLRDISVEIDTILSHYDIMDSLASTTFTLFRNAGIINFENLIVPDLAEDKPLYRFGGKPVFSRAVPFIMKKGMSKDESEVAMNIIHAVFLGLKGRQQLTIRSEYHEIMKTAKACLQDVRASVSNMPEVSTFKQEVAKTLEAQQRMLGEIYPDNAFKRMFASAALDARYLLETRALETAESSP